MYDGNILVAEYTDSDTIVYIYDANDTPIGFKYRANSYEADVWDVYWYGKNLQGDVLYVYNASGTKLISYTYNAWGNTTVSYLNGGASTTAVKNNLTYRGYYYDSDLGMYYLQTRYYDAKICRLISPDTSSVLTASPTALTDKNLFAYCDNNPVMRVDKDGEFWLELGIMAVGGLVGAITNAITSVVSQKLIDGSVNEKSVAVAAVSGFVSGAVAASPLGIGGQIIAGGIIGGLSYIADTSLNEEEVSNVGLAFAVGTGLMSGIIGGKGANHNDELAIAITGARNTKIFASIVYNSEEASFAIARAIVKRDRIILPAIIKFGIGSGLSNIINECVGKIMQ